MLLKALGLVRRRGRAKVLAELKPAGVDLANGRCARVEAPQHPEDRLRHVHVCGDPGPEAVLVLHKLRRGGALVRPVDATGARCLLGVGGVLVLGGKIVWVDDCPLQRRLQLEQPLADQRVGAESGGPSLDELTRRAAGFQPLRPSSRSRWLGWSQVTLLRGKQDRIQWSIPTLSSTALRPSFEK